MVKGLPDHIEDLRRSIADSHRRHGDQVVGPTLCHWTRMHLADIGWHVRHVDMHTTGTWLEAMGALSSATDVLAKPEPRVGLLLQPTRLRPANNPNRARWS